MQQILAQEMHALEATEWTALWERFTELSRGLFARRLKPMSKGEEITSTKGASGRDYEVEIGVAVEHERDLHFFVAVIDADTGERIGGDAIVWGR